MIRTLKSLIVPALLSALGFAVTIFWHARLETAERARESLSGVKVAHLKDGDRGIEKRPKARLIWQEIPKGTQLYLGDAVRTTSGAEGKVELDDGTVIAMEPDSLIVLETGTGGLELNLVSGSLFVAKETPKSPSATKTAAVIKAGSTKLVLGGGTQLSLSKAEGAQATVAVVQGDVAVKSGSREFTVKQGSAGTVGASGVDTTALIEALSPKPNAVLPFKDDTPPRATFRWTPLSKDYAVELALGTARSALKVATAPVPGDRGSLSFEVPDGPFYWQLRARRASDAGKTLASVVLKAETVRLTPPLLLAPAPGAALYMAAKEPGSPPSVEVAFAWKPAAKAVESRIEIAADPSFAKPLFSKRLAGGSSFTAVMKREGRLHWRVVDSWTDLGAISSAAQSFELKARRALAAPKPKSPADAHSLTSSEARPITLQWTEVDGASEYQVMATREGRPVADKRTLDTKGALGDLPPGTYRWRVRAIDDEGSESPWSAERGFSVRKVLGLAWTGEAAQTYITPKPQVALKWRAGPDGTRAYRFRFARDESELKKAAWKRATSPELTLTLAGDGAYAFEAEALDDLGATLAVAPATSVTVQALPAPKAPAFAETGPFQASASGAFVLRWHPVDLATSYVVDIRTTTGDAGKTYKAGQTTHGLTGLMPGTYKVRVAGVNARQVQGPFGPARLLKVPETSDIAPPSIQKLRVH